MPALHLLPGPGDLVDLPDFDDEDDMLTIEQARDMAEQEMYATPYFAIELASIDWSATGEEVAVESVEIGSASPSDLLAVIMADPSTERTMLAICYLRERMAKHYADWIEERAQELVDEDERERTKYDDRDDRDERNYLRD